MDAEEQEMDEDWADGYFGDDDEDEEAAPVKKTLPNEEKEPVEPQVEDSRKYGGAVARYENYKSSGSVFCILGGIGLFIGILNYMDVLPIMSNTFSSLVFIGIFGLFVILGIVSYQKAGTLKEAADKELEVTNAIKEWLEKNVTEETLAECDKKMLCKPGVVVDGKYFIGHLQLTGIPPERTAPHRHFQIAVVAELPTV